MNEEYLTVNEIANRLGVNEETVRRWIRNKKLEGIAKSKKTGYLIRADDYEKFCKTFYRKTVIQNSCVSYEDEIRKAIKFHREEIERLTKLLKD